MARRGYDIKDVVIYENKLNQMPLTGLNDTELKLFFSIVAKVKYHNTDTVEIPDSYLEEAVDPDQHLSRKRLQSLYESMYHKITQISARWGDPDAVHGERRIFSGWTRDEEKHVTYVQVDETSVALFNNLDKEFTRFELREYLMLPGIYPKQLYRLLKQWRSRGEYTEEIGRWRELMDIPESYKTKDITRRIINPSVEALRRLTTFSDLTFNYKRYGQRATHVHFKWTPERLAVEEQRSSSKGKKGAGYQKGYFTIDLPEYMKHPEKKEQTKATKEQIEAFNKLVRGEN